MSGVSNIGHLGIVGALFPKSIFMVPEEFKKEFGRLLNGTDEHSSPLLVA